jgi:photosystem II stability/assembly factor-like uncharacterized protein
MQMMFWRRGRKWNRGLLGLILLCILMPILFASGAFAGETEEAISDPVFGLKCPPGICSIPNGFLLGFRDKALAVCFTDENTGYIVGNNGLFLHTSDGGINWERIKFFDDFYNDVFFIGQKGWIVGEKGLIIHSADGGKSWRKQKNGIKNNLLSVFFVDENKGFAVGGDGLILKTEDAGSSWNMVDIDWTAMIPEELLNLGVVSINLYDVFFQNETLGFIVGDSGTILRTTDGGKDWALVQMADVPTIFSIGFKNDMEGWAVGHHGYFLKTENGGSSWERLKIGTENSLYSISILGDYGVIVGDLATQLTSIDGGKTWVKSPNPLPPPYPWFADVCIVQSANAANIVSVGKSIILNTGISK